jgi:hypothetical protein
MPPPAAADPSLDVESPDAVPYFNWDAPVTNAEIRRALADGSEDDKLFWTARILSEARYADVWKYLSLSRDVLPRYPRLDRRLGRKQQFWEYLIRGWQRDGLIR